MSLRNTVGVVCGLLIGSTAPVSAQDHVLGDWHGVLSTPMGELSLIVSIMASDDGSLRAELESPDQAPGRKLPMTSIAAEHDHLAFTIQRIAARYDGRWQEREQHWSGTFVQSGAEFPLVLERGLPPAKPQVEGLDGVWNGAVVRNGVELRLILRVETGDQGTAVRFDAPDMGANGLPVAGFARDGHTVRFTVPATGAQYEGVFDGDSRMEGVWQFPGRPEAAVTFVRAAGASAQPRRERPQTPEEPFPYLAEDVTFANPWAPDVTLAGTLTLPSGAGPFPAAVLISGSGPQDRDETVWGHKPFAVLADHLTRHGIAVLRYDDRGFAQSTGDFGAATSADFATDANAAVRYLLSRPEIAPDAIGFIGHSEGGMIAPIATASNDRVAFVVLLAGPGTNTLRLMRSQREMMSRSQGVSEDELARILPVVDRINAAVAASTDKPDAEHRVRAVLTPGALDSLGAAPESLEGLVQQFTTPWYRYFIQFDPAPFLARLRVPVLAMNGSLDEQVPSGENLAGIAAALAHNADVTVRELPGLNHLFQTAVTGRLGEYADITETFAPAAMAMASDWINARFGRN